MSVSPQSLARTRDKRSLKTPARFEDFSDMPPEVTYRNVIENENRLQIDEEIPKPSPTIKQAAEKPSQSMKQAVEKPSQNIKQAAEKPTQSIKQTAEKPSQSIKQTTEKPPQPIKQATDKEESQSGNKKPSSTPASVTNGTKTKPASATGKSSSTKLMGPSNTTPVSNAAKPAGPPRKKVKGHSLIANGPANKPFQCNTNINLATNQQGQNQNPPQTRYIASPANFGQGLRLIPNEALYLPCSVPTIAPITLTPQQILNYYNRRAPFFSKKAESCLKYQNERLIAYAASVPNIFKSIFKQLEIRDLLNIRLVNKNFRSLVESDTVWRRIVVGSSIIYDWRRFAEHLVKYGTKELEFDRYSPEPNCRADSVFQALESFSPDRLFITSETPEQNSFALELICHLTGRSRTLSNSKIFWNVKVMIDQFGIAQVDLKRRSSESVTDFDTLYCYKAYSNLLGHPEEPTSLDISEIEDLFSSRKPDTHCSHLIKNNISIRPI